jgi:hypothetical protein
MFLIINVHDATPITLEINPKIFLFLVHEKKIHIEKQY